MKRYFLIPASLYLLVAACGRPDRANDLVRRLEVSWTYLLNDGKHTVKLRVLNPREGEYIRLDDLITYGDKPVPRAY